MSTRPFFPCAGGRVLHAPTRREFLYSLGASLGSACRIDLDPEGVGACRRKPVQEAAAAA